MRTLMERLRRFAKDFVRTHIIADEKDLWPDLVEPEPDELGAKP